MPVFTLRAFSGSVVIRLSLGAAVKSVQDFDLCLNKASESVVCCCFFLSLFCSSPCPAVAGVGVLRGPALALGRDHRCSSVSASICWTCTGSSSLLFSFDASGILPAPFKLCSCHATDGNPFHVCVDCKKILVLNQLSLARVLCWSKWQRAWGWAEHGAFGAAACGLLPC